MDVYCISGLGADERIFSRLELPGVNLVPLCWLMPVPDEPMEVYADRMRAGIRGEQPVLLGVSFGGMMAIELAKKIPGAVVIIVSSVRERGQMPLWIKVGGRLYPRWLTSTLKKPRWWPAALENYFIGATTDADERLVQEFRNKMDPGYIKWSLTTIARWKNRWLPHRLYHIHGSRDRIFPLRLVRPTHVVPDGGHLMIFNRAEEVGVHLRAILSANGR